LGDFLTIMFPTQIPNFFGVVDASASLENSVALKNDNSAYTWGNNQYGNLGLGNQVNINSPQLLPFNNVTKVLSGFSTTSFQLYV
jgi:alpha-tubulin suppressor-like RCC1 family protein